MGGGCDVGKEEGGGLATAEDAVQGAVEAALDLWGKETIYLFIYVLIC